MPESLTTSDWEATAPIEEKICLHSCAVWGLGAFFYFYEFLLQTSTAVMVPDLMRAFDASGEQIGFLSACYLYAYAPMQIIAGMLMDRFGPRRLLTIATLFCVAGSVLFAMAPTFAVACIGRASIGVGGSFAVVGCLKLAALWFPQSRFALLSGIMVAVGMLGAAGGQAPMAAAVQAFGWQTMMLGGAVVGLILCPIMWTMMRPPAGKEEIHEEPGADHSVKSLFKGLGIVMRCRYSWIASLYAALMFVPTLGFGGLWGVPFLMESYGVTRTVAAAVISTIYLGWAVGGPVFGWYSDYIGRRKLPLMIATVGSLISMYLIWILPATLFMMGVILFILGIFSSGFVIAFSVVREINPPRLTGTAMGFINALNTLSGALAQPLLGKALDAHWGGKLLDGARVYSVEAYQLSLLAIIGCLVVSLMILPFVRETYCQIQPHE